MVETLLERAPSLPDWEFYAYRVPEDVEMAISTVQARTGGDLHGTLVTASVGDHNRIDLCYCSPATDRAQAEQNAFVATETLLGEELLDKWVGGVDVRPLPGTGSNLSGKDQNRGPRLLSLDRLKPTVDGELVASVLEQLSDKPLWAALRPGRRVESTRRVGWSGAEADSR